MIFTALGFLFDNVLNQDFSTIKILIAGIVLYGIILFFIKNNPLFLKILSGICLSDILLWGYGKFYKSENSPPLITNEKKVRFADEISVIDKTDENTDIESELDSINDDKEIEDIDCISISSNDFKL